MPGFNINLPPFPDNVPTHPLLVIDYELIKKGDSNEISRLLEGSYRAGILVVSTRAAQMVLLIMSDLAKA